MDISVTFRRRSLGAVVLYLFVIGIGFCGLVYWGLDAFLKTFATDEGRQVLIQELPVWLQCLELAHQNFYLWILPSVAGILFVLGLFGWLLLYLRTSSLFKQIDTAPTEKQKNQSGKKDSIDRRIEQERTRRVYLHSLTVFQREGRLLDFFDEDLSQYDDEQIGAAVRSIQEDCKKAVKKYIDPRPVIDSEEGESVTVEAGFDMDSISLVGNVSGEPPFKGILKHRGWKAGKSEIPKLSDIQDASIITPAEVEIE